MEIRQIEEIINTLNIKAERAQDSVDALRFSQAALNAAHSYAALASVKREG